MRRIERRSDGHDRTRFGDAMRRGEHRRAAEAVADQNRRCGDLYPQVIGSGNEIIDIRGESGVGEFAFTAAEPGEIETQYRDTVRSETARNQARRLVVFAAGKAMRE